MAANAFNMVLRDARPSDRAAITALLTHAHHAGPVARWVDPNPSTRDDHLCRHFTTVVSEALAHGIVRLATENGKLVGAACWLPTSPGTSLTDAGAGSSEGVPGAAAPGPVQRLFYLNRILHSRHPQEPPHHHLLALGVRPDRHGHGIGSGLLVGHHALLHTTRTPAYLHANDPRNHTLFLRHGYTDLGEPVKLPGGVTIWPMWREPVPADIAAPAALSERRVPR